MYVHTHLFISILPFHFLTLTLSHIHIYSTLPLSHSHTLSHFPILSLIYSHTLTLKQSSSLSPIHSSTPALSHSYTHPLLLTQTLTCSLIHSSTLPSTLSFFYSSSLEHSSLLHFYSITPSFSHSSPHSPFSSTSPLLRSYSLTLSIIDSLSFTRPYSSTHPLLHPPSPSFTPLHSLLHSLTP